VKPPSEPSADEPATEDTARPASKRAKTLNDEQDSARPDTGGAADRIDAAVTVTPDDPATKPVSSAPIEPDSSLAESHDLAQTAFPQTTEVTAARSTVALTEQVSAPRAPTLIDVVGSIVLNLVMGLIHVFDGPPVLPAGSNVTVRTSTLGSRSRAARRSKPTGISRTAAKCRPGSSTCSTVNDMFAGTHDGIYGAPQESIEIATDAGAATAVVLPMRSAQVGLIDLLLQALLDFVGQNFFVYEPLAGRPSALTAV
jgi:hypothetical protein